MDSIRREDPSLGERAFTGALTIQIGHRGGQNQGEFRTTGLILQGRGKDEMILDRRRSTDHSE